MTHNTRERIEEIITDYYDKFPECPQDLVGCTLNQDAVDEFNRARERGEKWLRTALHQQLQKARHDWLWEEVKKLRAIKSGIEEFDYDSDERGKCEILQTIIDRYQAELDQDKK